MEKARAKVIKTRISKWVICPFCEVNNLLKKEKIGV